MSDSLKKGTIPLRERRTLADEWRDFERQIMPKDAPRVQRVEMKRAWYAGAVTLFALVSGGFDADSEPTELDVAYLESISNEIEAYGLTIGTREEENG